MYYRYFVIISPWKRAVPLIWKIWIPITQGCFVPSLVEMGPVVLEKKIFKVRQCIFAISWFSPLGKWRDPSFEQTWIPITQECFVPSLVEIGSVVLEKKSKIEKSLQTDGQTGGQKTDGRRESPTVGWLLASNLISIMSLTEM